MGRKVVAPTTWAEVQRWQKESLPVWAEVEHTCWLSPAHRAVIVKTRVFVRYEGRQVAVRSHRDGSPWEREGGVQSAALRNLIALAPLLEPLNREDAVRWALWHESQHVER